MPALRLTRGQVVALSRLLDMMYKPTELAEEIGVTEKTIRRYIPEGMPYTRVKTRLWINGLAFRTWALEALATNRRGKIKRVLQSDEAYCCRCKAVVKMADTRMTESNRPGVAQVTGKCSLCGGRVNRLARRRQVQHDQS
ncbi:MAG TPA: hypothetical protein PKD23_06900 [Bellilinea sp.]|nr:hypothetical protein [Bellilinea sp.]